MDATNGGADFDSVRADGGASDSGASDGFHTVSATFCSEDNWCWEHPRPQGNPLYSIWVADDGELFAGGAMGTIVRLAGNRWTAQRLPLPDGTPDRSTISGIWGARDEAGSTIVYAVGGGGRIRRFDGTRWVSMAKPSPTSTRTLTAVWGSGPDDVFAVGPLEPVYHFDGRAWSAMSLPDGVSMLTSVWGTSPTDVFAVGPHARIVHYDGIGWSLMSVPVDDSSLLLTAIGGRGPNEVFAVGWQDSRTAVVWRYDGQRWTAMETPSEMDHPIAVWSFGADEVFVGCRNGEIWHDDGSGWTTPGPKFGAISPVASFFAVGPAEVFAAGRADVARWDGVRWTLLTDRLSTPYGPIVGEIGSPIAFEEQFYAVADSHFLISNNGQGWSVEPPEAHWLRAIWAPDQTDLYATGGFRGEIFRYVDDGWSAMAGAPQHYVHDLWGTSAQDLFVVGEYGLILHFDGQQWTTMKPSTESYPLTEVWGSGPSDVFAAGRRALWHYDGDDWQPMTTPSAADDIRGIWGTGPDDVFAVNHHGVWHYDGDAWSSMPGVVTGLWDVWGTGPTNVYAVGEQGTILHYDGQNWSSMASGTEELLQAVRGNAAGTVVRAFGRVFGTILVHRP